MNALKPQNAYLTTAQVAAASGATLRQLQWWDEQGLLRPEIIEGCRQYTTKELTLAKILIDLRKRGVPLRHAVHAMKTWEEFSDQPWLVIHPTGKCYSFAAPESALRYAANAIQCCWIYEVKP